MSNAISIILFIDIAFGVIFLLFHFVFPFALPAIENFLIKLFKRDKGNDHE